MALYNYRAKIIKVIDGDTVDADVDLGFRVTLRLRFRLYGLNTPELYGVEKEAGNLAKTFVKEAILGKDVIIETFKDQTEKYGRYLAKIYYSPPNSTENTLCLNDELLAKGYATVLVI